MPNRKQLLQDFYAKYAPNEQLTNERLAAIDAKYKDNDKQLLIDFYAKYAPDQELTDERYNAITAKYGLGKQPASPSGNGGASSSVQSAPPVTPSTPSGGAFKLWTPTTGYKNEDAEALRAAKAGTSGTRLPEREYTEEERFAGAEKVKANANAESQKRKEIDAANQEEMDLRKVDNEMPTEERAPKFAVPPTTNIKAQVYGNIAPNANTSLNLAELETRLSKETAKVPEGTTSVDLIGLKNEIEGKYGLLESDYLAFLESTDKARYDNYTSRLATIKEKGEATTDDQKFLRDFRNEALNIRLEADKQKVDQIKRQTDLPTYQAQSDLIREEARKLNNEYKSYFNEDGTPKSPLAKEKADAVANRINALGERQKLVQEKTGVTDEVLNELDTAYDSLAQGEVLQKGWDVFSELTAEERKNKEDEAIRKQVAETGSPIAKGALMLMSFTDAIGSGAVSMLETPKVLADALGYGAEDGWTDYLYDVSRDLNNKAAGRLTPLDSESTLMNIGDIFAKGAGNVVLFASGAEAAGAIKAGSTIMKNAGLVTSAFLMSEGQNYREALAAGVSTEDAAQYATMISAAQAMTEVLVPDFKYFDPATRKSIIAAIKEGKDVKEAFKQYGKQLLVDVPKTGLKEVGEELTTEVMGDVIKEGINAYKDATIYKDTFNPETYANVALTAFVTGGGLASLKRGVRAQTPNEEGIARMVGENADTIVENIVTTQPEEGVKVGEDVASLKEIVTGLKNIPSYEKLGEREKDFVVNKLMQKRDLEESMRMAGVKDEATKAEIEKIESDINAVYAGKKVGEEYTIEDAPEKLNVGDTVVFGKPEQNIVEEVVAEPISTQSGVEAVQSEEIVPEGVSEESTPIVKETEVAEDKEVNKDLKLKYGGLDKDLKGNPQKQWMKPVETSEQATDRIANFVEASDYKGREQSAFIDRNGKNVEVKLRNDDGKWNWYEPKSKKPFASFDNAREAIKFIQEQPFWDNGELNKEGKNDAYFAKVNAEYVKRELDNGNILEDINDGKISALNAIEIIENAGLEVPKEIVEALEQSSEETPQIEPVTEPVETKVEETVTQEGTDEAKVEETVIEEPPTPPTDEIDFDKGKGEEKEASRAKRIAEDESYRTKLNDYVKKYTSINVAAISELVEDYLPKYKKLVEEVGTKEANRQTVDFLLSLIANDVIDRTEGKSYTRSAFAMLAAQRIIREAMETGDTDTATTFNTIVDELGRQGGTLAALNNSGLSLDPLLNLFKELNASQKTALSQKTKSGRTKQDVLDEIKEESDSIKKDAAEELAKDESLDEAVTKVTEEPKSEAKVKPSKRAKLVKERADALDALKKIAFGQGLAATPKQGAQKSKELADAVIKIAKVEIQLGAYTLGEAVSKVYKQVRNYVSKQTVQEILGEVWDSDLIKLSNESRREEALEVLSDAIEGRSADKLFKALAKAMKIVNPDFIKAQKKGRRITDKQALQEILADKELAETLLNQAIEHIRAEMEMNGTYLDSVQAIKPSNMSDEQWNALRAKYVISKFKQFAQTVLETAEAKKEEVEIAQVVKDVAKQFYSKPTTDQSIHEALQAALPNLTLPQINKIAELVEERMQKLVESRDNRRIKALVKDITDGKNDSDMMKVLAKAMWNRGAMSTFQFANLLSSYLGFKGIPQNVVSQLIALLQNTAKMPSPLARQMAMKKVNNIASVYGETVWSYLDTVIKNILVRNILSSPKTGFSGGLSVFLTFPAAFIKQAVTRPVKTYRAFGNTLSGLLNGRFALKQSAKDIFIEHQTPIARELPRDANPYAKDNAWARTRKMSWKEAGAIWKQDKKKAISYNVAKALIIGNFQGRYVGFTNTINDFMSFLDYVSVSVLRDFYLGIETQRKMEMEGMGFTNDEWKQRMSLDKSQLDAIDTQVQQEVLQMAAIGQPVPKNYTKVRTQQLIAENQDIQVLERAHEKALQAILMSEPTTLVGTTVRSLFQSVENLGKPKVEGQMNAIGFALNRVTFPLTLFGRILIVLGEAGARYTPVFGTVVNMFPYEFTLKEGVPSIKRNADGSKMVKWSDKKGGDQREYAYRLTASMAVTSLVAMFLAYAFDDEEVVDENGNVVEINGEKVTRQRYRLSGFIDFYGNSPEISQEEKGALPRNAIRIRIGSNPDGTPIFKDIPIEWATPSMYGILKSICDTRDRQRYFDEQIMIGTKDGKDYKDLVQAPRLDVSGLSMSAGINAFNTDFSGVTRIVNGIRADRGIQAAFDAIFFEPSKRLVSPRQMEDVVHQIQNMNDQERIYINYKMEDDGMEGIVEYLMKDTWFTDPFIPNRENLESLDPFGFSVKFPPIYADFMGMFGTTATYAMASHEQEHKEYYNLYKDENGVYDPQKGTFPKRYVYSEATLEENGEKFKVKLSDDKERQISDDARREFRTLIDKNGLEKLAGYDYETRMIYLDYLWSLAKYKSVKTNLPTSTMAKPKRPSKSYMLPEDIEEKNARFLSLD